MNAKAPLLWLIDEEQPPERPEGLAAEALFRFLIEDGDVPACGRDLAGSHESREASADNDDVSHSVWVEIAPD
jgi:hypothetical protein